MSGLHGGCDGGRRALVLIFESGTVLEGELSMINAIQSDY